MTEALLEFLGFFSRGLFCFAFSVVLLPSRFKEDLTATK
jgi:hypothetical protein